MSDSDDTSIGWDAIAPVAGVVGIAGAAVVTAGGSVAAAGTLGVTSAAASGLTALGVSEACAIAAVSGGFASLRSFAWSEIVSNPAEAKKLANNIDAFLKGVQPKHVAISSAGWYFGGTNNLKICGGPDLDHLNRTG